MLAKDATLLVTGGAGFIGSALIRHLIRETELRIVNVDKLTYAGNLSSLGDAARSPYYTFEHIDICDRDRVGQLFQTYAPQAVVHLAAESHVDRSIDGPMEFINTNIVGTFNLLEASRSYWQSLPSIQQASFRFHHVSTDEVFGDLAPDDDPFSEQTPYAPSSPYSASKASSDHLVRSWYRTFGLPVLVTNCSNNYGPYQFPEKLVPLMILNAVDGKALPVYGSGQQIRDWLFVEDHAQALYEVLSRGQIGETYNIGGNSPRKNLDVVLQICAALDETVPEHRGALSRYEELIEHVTDRPGHDSRYEIDDRKIRSELGWAPSESFESGLRKTVQWFVENRDWCATALSGKYDRARLGLAE